MMNERDVRTAFTCLHAADDTYERVLSRAAGTARRARRGRAVPLACAVALGVVAALGTAGAAYAVLANSFGAQVWGDHGLGETISWQSNAMGAPATWSRSFGGIDADDLPASVADAVTEANVSTSGNGYTLTVHELVIDENGGGAATFTLSNPAGVVLREVPETGELALDNENEHSIDLIQMNDATVDPTAPKPEDVTFDTRLAFDRASRTDTSIDGVMYFTTFGTVDDLSGRVTWSLCWHEGDAQSGTDAEAANIVNHMSTTDAVAFGQPIATVTATDGSGATAWLAPLSLRIQIPGASTSGATEFVEDYVSVTMADGSERVIWDADAGIVNHYHSNVSGDGAATYALSQYLPVEDARYVTVRGRMGDPQQEYSFKLAVQQ